MVVMRHLPRVMTAHSAVWCQCNSRMPPGARCMLTPAISSEITKSSDVSSRAQPPFWMRFGEMLKEDLKNGCVLISVAGGSTCEGNWLSMTLLRGPSLRRLSGLPAVFTRPCGGKSGLPKLGVGWFGTGRALLVRGVMAIGFSFAAEDG